MGTQPQRPTQIRMQVPINNDNMTNMNFNTFHNNNAMMRPQPGTIQIQGSVDNQGNQMDPTQQRSIVFAQNKPVNVQSFNLGNTGGIQHAVAISSNQTSMVIFC